MSEEEKSSGRGWIAGVAVAALAVIGGIVSMLVLDEQVGPAGGPTPEPVPPRPTVTPSPVKPTIRPGARLSLPPPDDLSRPERPENPEIVPLTADMRREMNYFVNEIVKAARDECILPWMEGFAEPTTAEFVFDTVLYDGQMYDVGIRSLDHDLPEAVRSCIGDQAWSQQVPEVELNGEVRLQRSTTFQWPQG
ncbi:MAG: hypothetical protein AAGA48_15955 [Myxococcota bacterium]